MKQKAKRLLGATDEWCSDYHCAGDCGLNGHGWQHKNYKTAVLNAFDAITSDLRREKIDVIQVIRQKAKDSL